MRPLIPLKWIFDQQHGVSIVEHPPTVVNNLSSDTWSSTVEISYAVSSCSQGAKLQCEAQDIFNFLGQTKSTVEIYTGNKDIFRNVKLSHKKCKKIIAEMKRENIFHYNEGIDNISV